MPAASAQPVPPSGAPKGADTIRRNTAFALAVQLTTAVGTAVLTLFLVRALDPHGYGIFTLALAIGGLAFLPSDLGISASAARFIAEHRGDRNAIASILSDALKLKIAASCAISLLLAALAGPIAAAYDQPDLVWALRGVAVSLFAETLLWLLIRAFIAQGKVSVQFRVTLLESATETLATISLVLLGTGAAGATFGRAIGYSVGAGFALFITIRLFGRSIVSLRGRGRIRQVAGYGGVSMIVDGAWALFSRIDSLLIAAFLSAAAVGTFNAPLRLITFLQYPGLAASNSVAPAMARGRDQEPNVDAFVRAIRYLIVFQAALIAPLLVWSTPIVDLLLGSAYAESASVLRVLTPYVVLSGLAPLVSVAATFLGEARRRIPITLAMVATNVVIDVVLLPRIGVVGAAIGTDVAFALYVPAHLRICRRHVAFPLRPLAVTCLRCAVATVGMMIVLLAIGTNDLSLAQWVLGVVAAPAVFAALLVATREFPLPRLGLVRETMARAARGG